MSLPINNCINKIISVVFVILLQNLNMIVAHHVDTHNVAKRMDLDSCSGRFDVHRDTIIRTEESRSMGAKFLDDADLGNREECLRLCCETDGCDVFVFEEKFKGTCFLFQCGPPEDFRCKFTRHGNYTSAVLAPIRQLMPQTQSILPTQSPMLSLSQHELELANLKGRLYHNSDSTTTLIPPLGMRIPSLSSEMTTVKNLQQSGICSRFQFQCHSGECIAVYNACDGIPQCEDGSDEGSECPGAVTQKPSLNNMPQQQPQLQSNQQQQQQQQQLQPQQQKQQQQQKILPQQIQDMTSNRIITSGPSDVSSNVVNNIPKQIASSLQRQYQSHNREDPMTAPIPQWPGHQITNDMTSYMEPDSHIFNHKGGLQLPNNNIPSQYGNANRDSMSFPSQQRDNYLQSVVQDAYRGQMNQQQWMPAANHLMAQSRLEWPSSQQQQQQSLQQQQQQQQQQQLITLDTQSMQQIHHQQREELTAPQIESQQQQPDWPLRPIFPVAVQSSNPSAQSSSSSALSNPEVMVQQKNADKSSSKLSSDTANTGTDNKAAAGPDNNSEDEDSNSDYEEEDTIRTTEAPKKKQRKHKKQQKEQKNNEADGSMKKLKVSHNEDQHDQPLHEQLKIIKTDLEFEFADHDGESDRPGGAVLSLTLGIIVTAALAVLVGCRMRAVGRRVRRNGKSPYAHDADFLVNGMYL